MEIRRALGAIALVVVFSTGSAFAGMLNVACSNQMDWCKLMTSAFEEATGYKVNMMRRSTGETLAQIRAQATDPQVDVWWGGTGDPHLIAAVEGLTQPSNVETTELLGWAVNLADISDGRAIGIHAGALGIGYNTEILAEKNLSPPRCWRDLVNPDYSGQIQMPDPTSSGTAYTQLATFVQVFGEDEAFNLLAEIGANVSTYTSSGSASSKAAARGKSAISVGFMHDLAKLISEGAPLIIVAPCEGTGYEVGGVSIIKGAKNLTEAKAWVEFVISAPAQSLGAKVGVFNVPSNSNATVPPEAPSLDSIKLIDYDFATYGAPETRKSLLERWDKEVRPKH